MSLSIHAATKYMVGHSDAMLGVVTTHAPELWNRLKRYAMQLGTCAGPDDIYLGLRGLQHGHPAERHQATGIELAQWLQARPEVALVLHLACPTIPAIRCGGVTSWAPADCSRWN